MLCLLINIPLFMVVVIIFMRVTIKYSIDWTDAMVSFWTCVIILTSAIFIISLALFRIAKTTMIITVVAESIILTCILFFLNSYYLSGFP
jgi:hypothetical protein